MAEQDYRKSRYGSASEGVQDGGLPEDRDVHSHAAEKGADAKGKKRKRRKHPGGGQEAAQTPEQAIRRHRKRLADRADIVSFFSRLVGLAVLLVLLFGFVFGITPVADGSMHPVLSAGDLVLYYRLEDSFISQDVVVCEKDGETFIGRVVARGGDTVEITEDSQLKINGSTVVETNIYYATPRYDTDVEYPLTLEDDEYFILCDYRTSAKDSRYYGAVKKSEIKGVLIAALRRSGL